jgi:hypothetical protein
LSNITCFQYLASIGSRCQSVAVNQLFLTTRSHIQLAHSVHLSAPLLIAGRAASNLNTGTCRFARRTLFLQAVAHLIFGYLVPGCQAQTCGHVANLSFSYLRLTEVSSRESNEISQITTQPTSWPGSTLWFDRFDPPESRILHAVTAQRQLATGADKARVHRGNHYMPVLCLFFRSSLSLDSALDEIQLECIKSINAARIYSSSEKAGRTCIKVNLICMYT